MTEEVKIYRQHGIKEPALSEGEKAAREYRRQQQKTHARHADVQRQSQTHCARKRDQRDQPDRGHVASSSSHERVSHSSIILASVSSACCFSSISRASS